MNSVQERDRRVAIHEAAHLIADFMLGGEPGAATIEKRPAYGGRAITSERDFPPDELREMFNRPLPLLPPNLRSAIECRVMVLLAGKLAEDIHWRPVSGYVAPSTDERTAEELVRTTLATTIAPVTSDDREHLEADAQVPFSEASGDEHRAFTMAHAFVDDLVLAYLGLLRAATAQLVASDAFKEKLDRLVPILIEQRTVSARTVHALLRKES